MGVNRTLSQRSGANATDASESGEGVPEGAHGQGAEERVQVSGKEGNNSQKRRQLEVNSYPGPASMWSGLMRG